MALPATGKTLGIDRGVHVLAATSDGELIRNGRLPIGTGALSPVMLVRLRQSRSEMRADAA